MAEHRSEKPGVGSSILPLATNHLPWSSALGPHQLAALAVEAVHHRVEHTAVAWPRNVTQAGSLVLERGPKGKKFVAFAIDWPGWSRGAKTADAAVETLETYRERYRSVAAGAGLGGEFEAAGPLGVFEDRVGTGSVDFWGISFSPSETEHGPMTEDELERKIALLRSCWAYFDTVAGRVSAEMQKGPRGGGRDRDRIIRHTIRTESEDFAKKVGLRIPEEGALAPGALEKYREDYIVAIRAYERGEVEKPMRSWTLPFLIRHSAYHTMDHAWEMEDKDLTNKAQF